MKKPLSRNAITPDLKRQNKLAEKYKTYAILPDEEDVEDDMDDDFLEDEELDLDLDIMDEPDEEDDEDYQFQAKTVAKIGLI